jgi:hypothetical protein
MTEMRLNLDIVLICISSMARNVKHFFMYFLVICTSLENCSELSVQFICSFIWMVDLLGVCFSSSLYIRGLLNLGF